MSCFFARRTRAVALCAAVGILCLTSIQSAYAHGDHGGGADGSVLPQGITLVTLQYDMVSYKPLSDARLNDLATAGVEGVHAIRTIAVPSLALSYGLTKDLTITARLPYLANRDIRETDIAGPGITERGGVYGFGDASAFATYRVLNDTAAGLDAAVILGLKAPTGRTNALDRDGVLFESEHQPGSGSWDPSIGAAASKQAGLWSFSANALYTRAGAGLQDTRLGDRASYGIGASYRLWTNGGSHDHAMHLGGPFDGMMRHGGVDHPPAQASSKVALDVSLGLNGQWSGAQTIAGERDGNTGGNVVFLSPGARLSVDNWSGFLSVGVPVARHLNGIQSEPRLQATTGIAVKF